MSDMICRKTMTPCQTPGMCSPHGGCPATEQVSSAWLAQLRSEYVAFGEQSAVLKAENEALKLKTEAQERWIQNILRVSGLGATNLLAGIEAMRKGAERYRWIEPVFAGLFGIESMDAHIDAAMNKEKQV